MTAFEPSANPFPGLRPFELDEQHLFFGRDGQSDELTRLLEHSRFVIVCGASGSGKSSLVRAGLLPLLYGGMMTTAGSEWRIGLLRPGVTPIQNLALSLNFEDVRGEIAGSDSEIQVAFTEATLRRSGLGLVEHVRQLRMRSNENLLLVVEQFEEIFHGARLDAQDEATAFVKMLLEAAAQREVAIYVVLTVRSDFLGEFARFWELPAAHDVSIYLVPTMTRDQYREAIMGPVAVGGGRITPRLISRILNDIGEVSDQLPVLQHALMRTWDRWAELRDNEALDLSHYESIGGVSDSLSLDADRAFNELPDERARMIAEKLFKALTEKGADNRETRRPARVREISEIVGASKEEVISVIDRFRHHNTSLLMPPAGFHISDETVIDLSHESLIRNWRRLKDWVDEEARSARIYMRIVETAMFHERGQAGLWREPDLRIALDWRDSQRPNYAWASRYHPGFDKAMEFLEKSEEQAREESLVKREWARSYAIPRSRVAFALAAVLVLTVVSVITLASFYRLRREAATQRRLVDEQQIDLLNLKKIIEQQEQMIEQMKKEAAVRAESGKARDERNRQ